MKKCPNLSCKIYLINGEGTNIYPNNIYCTCVKHSI